MTTEKSSHPNYCPNYPLSLEELAKEIDHMDHKSQGELYTYLHKLKFQSHREEEKLGRQEYCEGLAKSIDGLRITVLGEAISWKVCKDYTEVETRD